MNELNELMRNLLWLPKQASDYARSVDHLHFFVFGSAMIGAWTVVATTLVFIVRYRRRHALQSTEHVEPKPVHEAVFIGVPLALFLAFFAIGYPQYVELQTPPKGASDVYVMAKKWMWKFAYPGGPNSTDVLRVPVGRPVRLLLTSRDVIHSFFVPALRLKQDALPGRYTQTWFQASEPGRYPIFCAEYCGLGHSAMLGELVVMPAAEFDAWLDEQRRSNQVAAQDGQPVAAEEVDIRGNLVEQGRRIAAMQGCFKCHTVDGTQHIGPTWLDLYNRKVKLEDGRTIVADEAYITRSMMEPNAEVVAGYKPVMPTFQGKLSAPEAAAIVEFIKTLRTDAPTAEPQKGPIYVPISGK
ncbi:MAG TPA: cytochrome c oxidase subunit II [Anaeromyxobacteraceae bacterium]|nr:cytochrome c oxidase subunit II [Anaeromyxobacteraceae bacterium]